MSKNSKVVIDAENLTRKFGEVIAVDGITFQVSDGEVFGFLGPNGAGKTTTMRILCCLISKTSGKAIIQDNDISKAADSLKIRKMIGFVPDNVGLYGDLTASGNLDFYAKLYEVPEELRKKTSSVFSRFSDSGKRRTYEPVRSPRACSRSWRWPVPWSMSRSCCSWTNRQSTSTRNQPRR